MFPVNLLTRNIDDIAFHIYYHPVKIVLDFNKRLHNFLNYDIDIFRVETAIQFSRHFTTLERTLSGIPLVKGIGASPRYSYEMYNS